MIRQSEMDSRNPKREATLQRNTDVKVDNGYIGASVLARLRLDKDFHDHVPDLLELP